MKWRKPEWKSNKRKRRRNLFLENKDGKESSEHMGEEEAEEMEEGANTSEVELGHKKT